MKLKKTASVIKLINSTILIINQSYIYRKMNKHLLLIISLISILGFFSSPQLTAQNIATQKQISFNKVDSIKVDADFCVVKLTGYDGNTIEFSGVIKSDENADQYKLITKSTGSKLNIEVQKPSSWTSHWGEIELKVPNGLTIEITSQSGKVDATSITVNNLNIKSKSGHVNITDVKGNIESSSPAGDFIVDTFEGNIKSRSKTGKVILSNVKGNFNLSSNKGDYTINQLEGNIKTDGGAGNQELENINGDISLKATSGDIKLSLAKGNITTRTFEGNQKIFQSEGVYDVQASTGGLTGTRIKFTGSSSFTTSEGNIKMQLNTKTDLAFILKSDSSYLRAMGKSKKKSLKVGKGSILITGTSTTGSQAYY